MLKVRLIIGVIAAIIAIVVAAQRNKVPPGMVSVKKDDPRMVAATNEAKNRWVEFERAFGEHKSGRVCAVKHGFRASGQRMEHIWVKVSGITGTNILGQIMDEPAWDIGHKKGDTVNFPATEISDWVYADKDGMVGGFTDDVLKQIEAEKKGR